MTCFTYDTRHFVANEFKLTPFTTSALRCGTAVQQDKHTFLISGHANGQVLLFDNF